MNQPGGGTAFTDTPRSAILRGLRASSLRYRLVAGIMGLTLVVCLIFVVGIHFAFKGAEQRLFNDHIKKEVDAFMEQYAQHPDIIGLPRQSFSIYTYAGSDKSSLPGFLRTLPADASEVSHNDHVYHVITRRTGGKSFYFLFDDSSFERFENFLTTTVVIIAITLCLSAALFGLSIARLIIGPVTDLAVRVGRLHDPGSEVHTQTPKTFDEIEVLENAFNSYQRRIARFLGREQEFSSDASHELRTPLMAVRSAAENLLNERPLDARVQELTTRIIRSCDQMSSVTEALLLLARESAIPADKLEELDVKEYLREQVELMSPMLKARNMTVQINEKADLRLRVYKVGLHIVIGNILKNAVLHSRSDIVRITLDRKSLEVEDFGRGISASEQRRLFDRHSAGAAWNEEKTGIGLSLAKRFCDEFGWFLELASTPSRGTRVRVDFG